MLKVNLYEYSVIRVVPRVERGECINAGILLYCRDLKFLGCKILLDGVKLKALDPLAEPDVIRNNLSSFEKIVQGNSQSGPIGDLPLAERFRWLSATRSTCIQCGPVHPGFCQSPSDELQRLFDLLVS